MGLVTRNILESNDEAVFWGVVLSHSLNDA